MTRDEFDQMIGYLRARYPQAQVVLCKERSYRNGAALIGYILPDGRETSCHEWNALESLARSYP